MLDSVCMGSAELFGTGREQKIQNENITSNPRPQLHDSSISTLDRSATLVTYEVEYL